MKNRINGKIIIIEALAKVLKKRSLSFPRKWESSLFNVLQNLWIPVFTGMTTFAKASIFLAILQSLSLSQALCADISNNQRGIGIKAKDAETGIVHNVPLYRKMYAVIIGIDKYENLPLDKQLSYAVKDAKGVENVLREKYRFDSFDTLYNEKATKSEITKILQGKLSKIDEEDAVFVFFAGHGTTQKDRLGGEELGYILPYDGTFEKDKMYLNISMSQLKDEVAKVIPAKHIFYVIDACYSGTLLAQRAGGVSPSHKYAYLQEITKEPVRQVLTAGTDKQTVLDGGPKGHSVFTGRFIEKLEETKDYITAAELGEYVKSRVSSDAQSRGHTQTPRDGSFYGLGDFVFVPNIVEDPPPTGIVYPEKDFPAKDKSVLAIAADPKGKIIAVGGIRGVELFDAVTGKNLPRLSVNGTTVSLQFSPDGEKLAIGGYKEIYVLDISTGNRDKLPTQHTDFIIGLTFSPDSSALASGSKGSDRTIEIIDLNDKKIIKIFKRERDYPEEIKFIQFSPDGKLLAASSLDDKEIIKIWNMENNQLPWRTLNFSENEELTGAVVKSMAFSPDGKYLAAGLNSGNIVVYDISFNQTNLLRIHSKPVIGIGFTKDSRYLISGDFDNLIKYSDIKDNTLLHEQNIEGEFNLLQIIPSTDVIKTEMIITSDKSKAYKYILPEFKEGNITR